ncbi:MAG: NUDIX domain-containing protein [Patescibacteria group bacterium]
MSQKLNHAKPCFPVVAALIERVHNGEVEILIQTRWKPERDPKYSGTFEIPVGWLDEYENVYDGLKREVFEETGMKIIKITPDIKTKMHSPNDDKAFAFMPFCCFQQLKDGKPWIGFLFLCEVEDKEPIAQVSEVKDIRWIKKSELKELFQSNPEKIFTLELGALDYYFNYQS